MRRLALLVALAACSSGDDTATPTPPDTSGGTATTPTLDGRLTVPAGFQVGYFAQGLGGVRFMTLGPDGAVYASLMNAGRVVRLPDGNADGAADSVVTVLSGLDLPHGLAVREGWLYVATTGAVLRARLGADGRVTGATETVARYAARGGHVTRTIVFGADGAMYLAMGSTCNICRETDPQRAAVTRYDANNVGRVFASGLRNAVGMAVHPTTGELWVTQNERDDLAPDHENLPPEELNVLRDGGDYGWPFCHSNRVPNPEFGDVARCQSTLPPALMLQAHSAPLGITFLDRAIAFPAEWRGDALVAYHGSWNRREPTGAKVVRVRIANGQPVRAEDFVVGWQRANGSRWGRPVDVLVAKDGAVLVSDDDGGAIFRVSYRP